MSAEAVERAIRQRRSIRGLVGPPLDADELESLVSLALTAPAPHHTQPWRFVEVSDGRRAVLAEAMGAVWRVDLERDGVPRSTQDRIIERSRAQVVGAPTLLLGCLVAEGLRVYEDESRRCAEWSLATHSFGAAMQNILLAASSRGLGAYWISAPVYAQEAARQALDLDAAWQAQALIALGHPSADYRPFARPEPDLGKHFTRR